MVKICYLLENNNSITSIKLDNNERLTDKSGELLLELLDKNIMIQNINMDATGISQDIQDKIKIMINVNVSDISIHFFFLIVYILLIFFFCSF